MTRDEARDEEDKMDLKVKVNKKTFESIQDACFRSCIFWDNSGRIKKEYDKTILCLYYRKNSNTIQYGRHEYNYNIDKAKEVTIDEFLQKIQQEDKYQFKEGDWITLEDAPLFRAFQLKEHEILRGEVYISHFVFYKDKWIKWKPKDGEWVAQRNEFYSDVGFAVLKWNSEWDWDEHDVIEPYFGKLPSFIKEGE